MLRLPVRTLVLAAALALGAAPALAGGNDRLVGPISAMTQVLDELGSARTRFTPEPRPRPRHHAHQHSVVTQRGNGNSLHISQQGGGGNNTFRGTQIGNDNHAGARQVGTDNTALIEQRGNANRATDLTQIGRGHVAIWRQIGNNLGGISITQTPGAPSVVVTQR